MTVVISESERLLYVHEGLVVFLLLLVVVVMDYVRMLLEILYIFNSS